MSRPKVIRTSAPQVAVLMAVHAGANPIELDQALASMRSQTYRELRLFVYCDGPVRTEHDQTLAMLGT